MKHVGKLFSTILSLGAALPAAAQQTLLKAAAASEPASAVLVIESGHTPPTWFMLSIGAVAVVALVTAVAALLRTRENSTRIDQLNDRMVDMKIDQKIDQKLGRTGKEQV